MIYITLDDLETSMTEYDLKDLIQVPFEDTLPQSGNTILDGAELIAIDQTFAFIGMIYDKSLELSKTGVTRDFFIVKSVIAILKHTIYQRVSASDIPAHIEAGYEDTINNLTIIQKRKVAPKIVSRGEDDSEYTAQIYTNTTTRTTYDY